MYYWQQDITQYPRALGKLSGDFKQYVWFLSALGQWRLWNAQVSGESASLGGNSLRATHCS